MVRHILFDHSSIRPDLTLSLCYHFIHNLCGTNTVLTSAEMSAVQPQHYSKQIIIYLPAYPAAEEQTPSLLPVCGCELTQQSGRCCTNFTFTTFLCNFLFTCILLQSHLLKWYIITQLTFKIAIQ